MIRADDGTVFDAVPNERGSFDIRANGVVFSHAAVAATAGLTMEEAHRCWTERPGMYTYEGENPFPQHIAAMLEEFPQYSEAIMATT